MKRIITDENEITSLLLDLEVNMINRGNNYQGELTTLDAADVKAIIRDARPSLGTLKATVEVDGDAITVIYPNEVCTLKGTIR